MIPRRDRKEPETVYRITAARRGLSEDVRARQVRYTVSMVVRAVAVIALVLLWDVSKPLALAALLLGVGIPYFAVIFANGGREGKAALPSRHLYERDAKALPGPAVPSDS